MTTFSKLRNGSWGLRGKDLTEGSSVTVTKRSGETQTVVVGKVIWRGSDGTCLAAKGDAPANAPVSYDRRSSSNAPHHRAMGGLCGQCAFDEYDC